MTPFKFATLALLCTGAFSASQPTNSGPIVKLSYGSFQGNTSGSVTQFLGMSFAAPPYVLPPFDPFNAYRFSVGNLRFSPPQPPVAFRGVRQATSFGAACFQQAFSLIDINVTVLETIAPELGGLSTAVSGSVSEDCTCPRWNPMLSLNLCLLQASS